jgi:RNA polymerase sigma-70 factor (ECF subfamily)
LIDRVRQQQMSLRLEQRMEADALGELPQPRTVQAGGEIEAEETWERLLHLCPPQHRELLKLKRQGLALAEIAQRTNLHEGSVRRILYELAAKLAERPA